MKLTIRNIGTDTNIGGEIKAVKEDFLKLNKLIHMLYKHECDSRGIKCDRNPMEMVSNFDYIYDRHFIFFIECDGKVVGTFRETKGNFYNLVIAPKYRRKGIVKWLFNELYKGQTIRLQVRESNEVAMEVYEALGFEVEEDWGSYYTMVREA
ncbi:MAG: GNAT family N-acetyltransferase [Cetobacterium sp.]|uniref:GNAT family N-acetyltransferase n=1 Tax=Cetobacterium sp. TaxID=2071632 RepID=UPI003F2DA9FA